MIEYFVVLLSLIIGCFAEKHNEIAKYKLFLINFFILLFFLGFRSDLGGDYITYKNIFYSFGKINFVDSLFQSDPIFSMICNILYKLNLGIESLIFLQSFIFIFGLFLLASFFNNCNLIILFSFPILIIIVGIGYYRQSMALGFFMIALYYYIKDLDKKFLLFSLLSILVHSSFLFNFLIIFIFHILVFYKNILFVNLKKIIIFIFTCFILSIIVIYLNEQYLITFKRVLNTYFYGEKILATDIKQKINSFGVHLRFIIAFFPLVAFYVLFKKNFFNIGLIQIKVLFFTYCFILLALLPIIGFASVFVDRILLSFIVIGVLIISYFDKFLKMYFNKNFLTLVYALYNLIIVYGFLQYSVHRRFWVPYNSLFY